MKHQQQTAFENIVEKEEIACNDQFLLFPQCFLLNQITVPPFVHIFDFISLFAAELKKPKIGISGKGLNPQSPVPIGKVTVIPTRSSKPIGSMVEPFLSHRFDLCFDLCSHMVSLGKSLQSSCLTLVNENLNTRQLTLYHTVPTFYNPERKSIFKHR